MHMQLTHFMPCVKMDKEIQIAALNLKVSLNLPESPYMLTKSFRNTKVMQRLQVKVQTDTGTLTAFLQSASGFLLCQAMRFL